MAVRFLLGQIMWFAVPLIALTDQSGGTDAGVFKIDKRLCVC